MNLVVLIVDDELLIAEETSIGLELEGYQTLIAESAGEALDILATRPDVGVLVTDVRMPGVDGIALANQLLASCRNHDLLSVILMTGHAEDIPPKGVAACIAKPFSMSTLVKLVAQSISDVRTKRNNAIDELETSLLLL